MLGQAIPRRRFHGFALALLAGLMLPGRAPAAARRAGAVGLPGLAALEPRPAARFGLVYLQSHPDEAALPILDRLLRQAIADERRAAGPARSLLDTLRARIRSEYLRDEVVAVEGWLLSRSEARLCAAAALSLERERSGGRSN